MVTLTKWSKYWQNLTSPLHHSDTKEYYQQYCAELKILFLNKNLSAVLDIGCGNGDLYEYLDFDKVEYYKGVDFSPSMLENFKEKYPGVNLSCCDASNYCDDKQYDLIFSNGVIQYFDYEMMSQHFLNVKKMMHANSTFICASVPWRGKKFSFFTGELSTTSQVDMFKGSISYLKSLVRDSMGTWYDLPSIKRLATAHNMSVEFYASMHYLYRFHAVLKLN